jgi:phage/plasmid-like protein (TIGR03299 family)|tara:strand:- start:71 stop:1024 length:954 start_codon:yes stop_codon:yes gene_type:complete
VYKPPTWHKIGQAVNETLSKEDMLKKADADYEVILSPVQVEDLTTGKFVTVEDRYVTGRLDPITLELWNWEVVKGRYQVVPNEVIIDKAIAIVNKSSGNAVLESVGTLDGGRKFFASVRTTQLTLSPDMSTTDIIDNYIVIMTSHDGSIPICYYNLDSRRINSTIYRVSSDKDYAFFSLRKRHTPNATDRLEEASEVLMMRDVWTKQISNSIESLSVELRDYQVNEYLRKIWSFSKANTKKKREYTEFVHDRVKQLYQSKINSGTFGDTKWSLFNAICEFYDFHRNVDELDAIQQSFEIDNLVHRDKLTAYKILAED